MRSEESEQRAYVDEFLRRFEGKPKYDALATFMRAVPLGTAHNIARVMMAYDLNTTSPIWVTFAITVELLERLETAAGTIPVKVRDELMEIDQRVEQIGVSAEVVQVERAAIEKHFAGFATLAAQLVQAGTTYRTIVDAAEARNLDAMRKKFDELAGTYQVAAQKKTADVVERMQGELVVPIRTVWGAVTAGAVALTAASAFFLGAAVGRHDGVNDARGAVIAIIKDGAMHRDHSVRAFAQNELRRLRLQP